MADETKKPAKKTEGEGAPAKPAAEGKPPKAAAEGKPAKGPKKEKEKAHSLALLAQHLRAKPPHRALSPLKGLRRPHPLRAPLRQQPLNSSPTNWQARRSLRPRAPKTS